MEQTITTILYKELLYVFLAGVWLVQLRVSKEKFASIVQKAFWLGFGALLILLLYTSYIVYTSWQSQPITKFLLPPYSSTLSFGSYLFIEFFAEYAFAFGIALIGLAAARMMNFRFYGRFFY